LLFVKKYGRTEGLKERIILGMNLCWHFFRSDKYLAIYVRVKLEMRAET
jgi:hypothetical protein